MIRIPDLARHFFKCVLAPSLLASAAFAFGPEGPAVHGVTNADELLYAPGFRRLRYVRADAPKGGEVVIGRIGAFETLNPFYPRGRAAPGVASLMFLRLGGYANDDLQATYGGIARDFEVSPRGDRMAVNIRDEAVWQDGSPITAEDVTFTLEVLRKHGYPYVRDAYRDVESASVEGPKRVVFRFKDANNPLLPSYIAGLMVLSKSYYSAHRFDALAFEPPLGNGPYRTVKIDAGGKEIVFQRIPNHWSERLPVRVGLYNLDRVTYQTYREDNVLFEAFKAGAVDLFYDNVPARWAAGYDFPAARDGRVRKAEMKDEGALWPSAIVFNLRLPKFKDRRVREALAEMIPFKQINSTFYWDEADRMDSVFFGSHDLSAQGKLPDADELELLGPLRDQVPPEVFDKPFASADASDSLRENARRAIKLFQEAGYDIVPVSARSSSAGRMVRKATGEPFEFDFVYTAPSAEKDILLYRHYLARIGVRLNPTLVESARREDLVKRLAFEAQFGYMPGTEFPGPVYRNLVGSENANVPNTANLAGIVDPAVDALVEAMSRARTRRGRAAAARALDRVLLWNRYFLPGWEVRKTRMAYWDKFEHSEAMLPNRFDPISEWWTRR